MQRPSVDPPEWSDVTGANGLASTLMTNSQLSRTGWQSFASAQMGKCSSTTQCGSVWSPPNKHWFDRSGVRWLESHSNVSRLSYFAFLSSVFPGPLAPPLVPGSPLVRFLPVWPTTRFSWPPPCSLRDIWGVRTTSFPSGELRCAGLSRSGARVSTNIRVQDFDLLPGIPVHECRLEVVADGLPLFHGAQLAADTTLVSEAAVRHNRLCGLFPSTSAEELG